MNRQHIVDMLQMQDKLNCVINPDWITANYPWHRAIYVEAVEALDHYGWKWWKDQQVYSPGQIQLELVDIWHFALSLLLANHDGDVDRTANVVTDYFAALEADPDAFGEITNVQLEQMFDLLAGSAAIQRQLNGPAFNILMKSFGLTWEQLYSMYVGKNLLNLFRQSHGYKGGTYKKIWGGAEDNEVLEALMSKHPDASVDRLNELLEESYAHLG